MQLDSSAVCPLRRPASSRSQREVPIWNIRFRTPFSCSPFYWSHRQPPTTVGVATIAEVTGIAIITAAAVLCNRKGAYRLRTPRRPQRSLTERFQRSSTCQELPPIAQWSRPAWSPADGPHWYGWRQLARSEEGR